MASPPSPSRALAPHRHPTLVAVTGASASGKGYLVSQLARELTPPVSRLEQDQFYLGCSHLSKAEQAARNFDVPTAIDWATFMTTLRQLRQGSAARTPQYNFATHSRRATYSTLQPAPVILVDGLWLLHETAIRSYFDLSIFVDCPQADRLERRIHRDQATRGRTRESVIQQFEDQVLPCENRWILPARDFADTQAQSPLSETALRELVTRIENITTSHQANTADSTSSSKTHC